MSRTIKGTKPPGHDEYWSRRPCGWMTPSSYAKKVTHRAERNAAKRMVRKEQEEKQ